MPEQLQAVENSHSAQGYKESPLSHEHICYHIFIGTTGEWKQIRNFIEKPGCTMNKAINDKAIQIVLAGDFSKELPQKRQLETLRQLIKELQEKYHIPTENVQGHKDASQTSCPGENLYKLLPHSHDKEATNH